MVSNIIECHNMNLKRMWFDKNIVIAMLNKLRSVFYRLSLLQEYTVINYKINVLHVATLNLSIPL